MKKTFTMVLCFAALFANAQFVNQPLNYPSPGYWPYFISVTDPLHVWIGTIQEEGDPYSFAVHTRNGGNSWIFDSIPVPGYPICSSIGSIDSNICFYLFTDAAVGEGSIWKTTDQGANWTKMTTTQFAGGYANFFHPFTADTGVAMGDPVGGYFEIELTYDGGASWQRLPETQIPAPLQFEFGISDCYSAVGNSIWFVTNQGRCFRSTDRGLNWQASQVFSASNESFNVCFSSEQNGAYWRTDSNTGEFAITTDGGNTWETRNFKPGYLLMNMCSLDGYEQGFIITAWKNSTSVYFTPDMFETFQTLGQNLLSSGAVDFLNTTTGWLSGGESGYNEILKFTGIIDAVETHSAADERLSVFPNPSSGKTLLRFIADQGGDTREIMICRITGEAIKHLSIPVAENNLILDASNIENGMYLLQLKRSGKVEACQKWIVVH